jgi:type I restriction enzyme, S subunit
MADCEALESGTIEHYLRGHRDRAALAGFDSAAAAMDYRRPQCAVFRTTRERWGGLSNMAGGFPVVVNGVSIRTSEALYQVCRFPHLPDVQREVIAQASPLVAKWKSRKYFQDSRPDFSAVNVAVMWWSLRVKLACHPETFGGLLAATEERPIVEHSGRDRFWGAVSTCDDGILVGRNVLGRLLEVLRGFCDRYGSEITGVVPPLDIADFLLYGDPIETVRRGASQMWM